MTAPAAAPVGPGRPGFEALGFDPAPGQLAAVDAIGRQYDQVSRALGDAHQALGGIGQAAGDWQGQAAQAFQETVGELPRYLDAANRSFGVASQALQVWHADLGSLQQQAVALEAEAARAAAQVRHAGANPDLGLAGRMFPDAASLHGAQQRLDTAIAGLQSAESDLAAVRERGRGLLGQHAELAAGVAAALVRAREKAPAEPGSFEQLGETLGRALDQGVEAIQDRLEDLAENAWGLVQDNANLIAAVSDVLGDLSIMAGATGDVLGFIPSPVTTGLDSALNLTGLGLQGLALGGHLTADAAGADVHPFTIGTDLYGLGSGAIGLAPGATGAMFDAGGVVAQWNVERASGGQVPTFWGDLGDYWVPKNPVQHGLYTANGVVPGIGLAVPFWNAVEQGHQKDVQARQGR